MLGGEAMLAIPASDTVKILGASEKTSLQTQQSRNQRNPKGRGYETQENQAGLPGHKSSRYKAGGARVAETARTRGQVRGEALLPAFGGGLFLPTVSTRASSVLSQR